MKTYPLPFLIIVFYFGWAIHFPAVGSAGPVIACRARGTVFEIIRWYISVQRDVSFVCNNFLAFGAQEVPDEVPGKS
jgi:hypothetical protein